MSKERLEVFSEGSVAIVDNFRKLHTNDWPGLKGRRLLRQDKGQGNCARTFVDAIESGNGGELIPLDEILEVSRISIEIAEQLRG